MILSVTAQLDRVLMDAWMSTAGLKVGHLYEVG